MSASDDVPSNIVLFTIIDPRPWGSTLCWLDDEGTTFQQGIVNAEAVRAKLKSLEAWEVDFRKPLDAIKDEMPPVVKERLAMAILTGWVLEDIAPIAGEARQGR